MTTAPLDLLRQKRLEHGIPDPADLRRQYRGLLLKGSLIGTAVLAGSVLITAVLFVRQQMLTAELDRLALVEAQVQTAETQLKTARGQINRLKQVNRTLVEGLVNARSGSALMRDLQLRIPQGVQITSAEVNPGGTSLRLEGAAADPLAFARINALQIALGRSPLLLANSVTLRKASRGDAKKPVPGTSVVPAGQVAFELTAQFRPVLPAAAELQLLNELGATGMAARLQMLQAQGLL